MKKRVDIYYPEQETYFICWDNERQNIKSYDSVAPQQCFSTNWQEIDYFTDKDLWIEVLVKNNLETKYL